MPSVQAMTSAGIASMRRVGLEIGKISGRSVEAAIAWMTSRLNAPCTVEQPSRMVGAAILMLSIRPTVSPVATPSWLRFLA